MLVQEKVSVHDLAKRALASEMTIRRYLDELERTVTIQRVRGDAIAVSTNTEEKSPYFMANEMPLTALAKVFECSVELHRKQGVELIVPGGRVDHDSDVFKSEEGLLRHRSKCCRNRLEHSFCIIQYHHNGRDADKSE